MEPGPSRSLRGLILRADALLVVFAMAVAYLLHAFLRNTLGFFRAPAGPSGFILLGYLALHGWAVARREPRVRMSA